MSAAVWMLWLISLVAVGVGMWWWSAQRSRARLRRTVQAAAERVRRGVAGVSAGGEDPWLPELDLLRDAVVVGYVPRGAEALQTAKAAVARVSDYLEAMAARPLRAALSAAPAGARPALQRVIDALDDIRMHRTTERLDLKSHDLRQVLQEVVDEFARDSRAIVKLAAPNSPVRVKLDKEALKDATYLVLLNAEQFSEAKPVEVRVTTEGSVTRIVIRDRGPGFSAAALERGLAPFFTTEDTALGLGLSHALAVILAHRGDLRLANAEGGGAQVEITLPLEVR
ncbi:MAG: HAMP domain-containing histidine kinase [Gemmatimonadetes bacterium]|nr:HAMP domain-containing histidine kinase [Gemmatimonadota bacterium]